MPLEDFDYGSDEDLSSTASTSNGELDTFFGVSGGEQRRAPKRQSVLAELNTRVILQVAVAVVLLAIGGGLLAREAWARRARDMSFKQMTEAREKREHLRIIEGAEKFLTHLPSNSSDAREADVINLYSEALVHWVANQPGNLDAPALARVERFKKLVKDGEK